MKRTLILALLALGAFSACGKSDASAKPAQPAAETAGTEQQAPAEVVAEPAPVEPVAPAPVAPTPTHSVVVTHRVKDFDTWKAGFDAGKDARQQAGVVAHHLNRGVADPKLVVVYLVASDLEKLKAFIADPALKDTMKSAGVIGKPTIEIVTPVENRTMPDPTLPALVISHEVKDFDTWKTAFDAGETQRTEAGIVGYALNRDQEKPNVVMIYAQGKTSEALETFASSRDLKKKMKEAGVKGQPKVTLVQGVEVSQYPSP